MKELELRVGDLKLVISSVGNGVKAVKGNMVEDLGFRAPLCARACPPSQIRSDVSHACAQPSSGPLERSLSCAWQVGIFDTLMRKAR